MDERKPVDLQEPVFRNHDGKFWSTLFGNDLCAPIREQPGIFQLTIGDDQRWRVQTPRVH